MPITIRVQNFQSIDDATLVVDGLTAITGGNNLGKSAFFRAVHGLCHNAPGHSFVRHGAEFCRVQVTFDDGSEVVWEKGHRGINRYQVNGGKWLENVGRGVPEEAVKVLGIHPITAASRTFWPQVCEQFTDTMFLMAPDMPGSVLAEAVADVERVGRINAALKASEKDYRSVRSTLKVRIKDQKRLLEELEPYKILDDVDLKLAQMAPAHKKIRKMRRGISELNRIQSQLEHERGVIQSLSGISKVVLPDPEKVTEIRKLQRQIETLEGVQERLNHEEEVIRLLSGVEEVDIPDMDVDDLRRQLQELESVQEELSALEEEVRDHEEVLEVFEDVNLEDLRNERLARKAKKARDAVAKIAQELNAAKTEETRLDVEVIEKEREIEALSQFIEQELGDMEQCPVCGTATGAQKT